EDLGDVLGLHLVGDRAVVIAVVEGDEIERLDGLGLPKTKSVAGTYPVAEDRRVIGFALDLRVGKPLDAVPPLLVRARLGMAAKLPLVIDPRTDAFPGIAEG